MNGDGVRTGLKRVLALPVPRVAGPGVTILTYHRVGGGTADELDVAPASFAEHVDALAGHDVVALDAALDRLAAGDDRPCVVLTFDDGFADVHRHAWPRLAERGLPFTLYLATRFVGATLSWEGSTSGAHPAPALDWEAIAEMTGSGLCTLGNHTHSHVRPGALTLGEVDACTEAIVAGAGVTPRHFAYPWGEVVPAVEEGLRARFRSAVTGRVGRNRPGADPFRLARVPVRRTDPPGFFRAKLAGRLLPERAYGGMVAAAKRVRAGG